jgi:hypothetical protein
MSSKDEITITISGEVNTGRTSLLQLINTALVSHGFEVKCDDDFKDYPEGFESKMNSINEEALKGISKKTRVSVGTKRLLRG